MLTWWDSLEHYRALLEHYNYLEIVEHFLEHDIALFLSSQSKTVSDTHSPHSSRCVLPELPVCQNDGEDRMNIIFGDSCYNPSTLWLFLFSHLGPKGRFISCSGVSFSPFPSTRVSSSLCLAVVGCVADFVHFLLCVCLIIVCILQVVCSFCNIIIKVGVYIGSVRWARGTSWTWPWVSWSTLRTHISTDRGSMGI